MGTLLPAIGSCSFATSGERRFAERLVGKLEDDSLCWYDVPVGPHRQRPDFLIFLPGHGLLVLEVKDWTLDTIESLDPANAVIIRDGQRKSIATPIEQARSYMFAAVDTLEKDSRLVSPKGRLICPYGHGAVLTNVTRRQFEGTDMREAIPSELVICKDEMAESADPAEFQRRLSKMFLHHFPHELSPAQIDRVRWHLFPEVRIGSQEELFPNDKALEVPDLLRVMDLQQEQLARSLGDGHRIIHGVAGSGKTLILLYRAEHLALACRRPILVLCFNKALAAKLEDVISSKGLGNKVLVRNFHKWVWHQLADNHLQLPSRNSNKDAYAKECVELMVKAISKNQIFLGQYDAVLIDEGHDFQPEWLKLAVQMINPVSKSLLLLYDDAQSIYEGPKKKRFTFASVGVEARGRTTILKMNYRNTMEILAVARAFAEDLLTARETADDEAPLVLPMSAGRSGPMPVLVPLASPRAEADYIAGELQAAHKTGTAWKEMAVIYRSWTAGKNVADVLTRRGVPFEAPQFTKTKFNPANDSVKLITMHSSKGLEFPLVCIPSINEMPGPKMDAVEEARLIYVAMTRATRDLVLTHVGESAFTERMRSALKLHS